MIQNIKPLLCLLAWLCLVSPGLAGDLGAVFDAHKATGTIVIERMSDGNRWVHHDKRAEKRFIPASTFKIPNTIFALESNVVANVDEIVPWDGKVRRIKSWNKPQSLRDAIAVSAVPVYQELSRRIGLEQMQQLLSQAGYGNAAAGSEVDRFWLQGPLRISAKEQIGFLKRLYRRDLPFSRVSQDATIEIMQVMRDERRVLRAKTGWEVASDPDIGWYVGWLESQGDTIFFALNIDMTSKQHRVSRSAIALEALALVTGETMTTMTDTRP